MSSLCSAVINAAGRSMNYANGRVTLSDPKVVVSRADGVLLPSPTTSPTFPDHAVVRRADAVLRRTAIVWDPFSAYATGTQMSASVVPSVPAECPGAHAATAAGQAAGQSLATAVGTTVSRTSTLVWGLGGLVILGAAAFFGYRYFKRR